MPNSTRRVSNPRPRRRAQDASFHAMSRSTMPTTPRDAASAAIRGDERVADRRVDVVEPAGDLEGRRLAQHADAVGLVALAAQGGGVQPDAVHVGVDQVGRDVAGGLVEHREARDVGPQGIAEAGADPPAVRQHGRVAHDPRGVRRRIAACPSGSRCDGERPLHDVHVMVPQPGNQPGAVARRAPGPRGGSAPAGAMSAISAVVEEDVERPLGRQQLPAAAGDPRVADRADASRRAPAPAVTTGPSRRGRGASRRRGPGWRRDRRRVSSRDHRLDDIRGLVLAQLALGDHPRRRQPEADRAPLEPLDEGGIVRPLPHQPGIRHPALEAGDEPVEHLQVLLGREHLGDAAQVRGDEVPRRARSARRRTSRARCSRADPARRPAARARPGRGSCRPACRRARRS